MYRVLNLPMTRDLGYFKEMKFLVFILVLSISAQPLQAGFCDMDMEKSQESPHHMDQSNDSGHDCCDPDSTDSTEGCDSAMGCGICFVSVSALPSILRISPVWERHYYPDLWSGIVLPSHSSPPFRPPIS